MNVTQDMIRKLHWLALLLLVVVPFAVFSPTLSGNFTDLDDNRNIYENPHVTGLSASHLKWMFTDVEYARRYMPLGWIVYAVDQELFGLNAFTYHFGNLLVHMLNGLLVYLLLRRLLEFGTGESASDTKPMAMIVGPALGALLWALNPLRVENVGWACGRIYVVAAAFFFSALLAYLRGAREEMAGRSGTRWRWLAVVAYLASLLTYPIAIFGAWAFLLLEIFPLKHLSVSTPWRAPRRVLLRVLPLFACAALMFGFTLWCNFYARKNAIVVGSLPNYGTPAHKFMQSFFVWVYYVWKPWLPFNLAPHPPMLLSFNPFSAPFIASFAGVTALTVWLWRRRAPWPAVWVGWLAHLGLLVPMLGLAETRYFPADRYQYVIGLIPVALIAGGIWKIWNHSAVRYAFAAAAAILLMFCGLAMTQSRVWHDAVSLRQRDAECAGESPYRAHTDALLGAAYLHVGSNELAAAASRAALARHPNLTFAMDTLGDIAQAEGRLDEAVARYDEVIRLDPNSYPTRLNRGVALGKQGKLNEAVSAFRVIVESAPDYAPARQNLAFALELQGRTNDARLVASGKLPPLQTARE